MKAFSAAAFLVVASHVMVTVVNGEAILHSFDNPKLTMHTGDETAGITTWMEAYQFCDAKGRMLAHRNEWCNANWMKWTADDVYGGAKPGSQWAPVRDGYNKWVQVGDNGDGCQTYDEVYGIGQEAPEEYVDNNVYCQKPADCTGSKCEYTCDNAVGFYPDPTDCQAYCYCSGSDTGSYWENVEEAGFVWDPWCENSDPVDARNVPLAGMTGGCKAHDHYVDDNTYCSPETTGAGRRLANDLPAWGRDPDKQPDESNYILCALISKAPEFPQTCATVWGDPHMVTYDGLKYDCQGKGDHVLAKSLDSDFELQGRFTEFSDLQATVTTGIHFRTGRPEEPDIELDFTWCWARYYVDGVEKKMDSKFVLNGTLATDNENVHLFNNWVDRWFWYPGSGISLHFRMKRSANMGCYYNVKLCIPDDIKSERMVGIFGSPNANQADDFMARDGTSLDHQGNTEWEDAFTYCAENWCIDDNANNHFMTPGDNAHCKVPYDPALENSVKNASPELQAICGGNTACLIEGAAGGTEEAGSSVTEQADLGQVEEVEITPESEEAAEMAEQKQRNLDDENPDIPNNPTPAPAPAAESTPPAPVPDPTQAPAPAPSPPITGSTGGDPHFLSWNGFKYDFHGGCDMVLVRNPSFAKGLGMTIQIRTKIETWWSYIESVVIQIGDQTLEVSGGANNINGGAQYWVNSLSGDEANAEDDSHLKAFEENIAAILPGFKVNYHKLGPKKHRFRINLNHKGDAVSIETFKDFVRVNAKAVYAPTFEGTDGMMGVYPNGDLMSRDGTTVMTDVNEFGNEWRVLSNEPMLFHSNHESSKHGEHCAMPTEKTSEQHRRRRLGESLVSQGDADMACLAVDEVHFNDCVFDVLATNDKEMAGSYD